MRVTEYRLAGRRVSLRVAFLADFHDGDAAPLIEALRLARPDIILVAGDLVHDSGHTKNAFAFLRGAVSIAPVFCSLGNHEARCGADIGARLAATGVRVLDNEYATFGGLVIGGLSSGFFGKKQGRLKKTPMPALDWLDAFCAEDGVRVLLSHHPEYYPRYLSSRPIDLVLSGHAHGGQWRAFGRGLFAPGQGLFPRFTAGAYRGSKGEKGNLCLSEEQPLLIVSRGLFNQTPIPRINNPEELILLNFEEGLCTADTDNE